MQPRDTSRFVFLLLLAVLSTLLLAWWASATLPEDSSQANVKRFLSRRHRRQQLNTERQTERLRHVA